MTYTGPIDRLVTRVGSLVAATHIAQVDPATYSAMQRLAFGQASSLIALLDFDVLLYMAVRVRTSRLDDWARSDLALQLV